MYNHISLCPQKTIVQEHRASICKRTVLGMIYICFLALFFLAAFLDISQSRTTVLFKKGAMSYLLFCAVLFIGLRYYTGADWNGYIHYFENVTWENKTYGFGYKTLNIVCKMLFGNYYAVQFFSSLAFILSVYRFFKTHTHYIFTCIFLAVAIYFSELFMCQVRQSLAIAILLFGIDYLLSGKWVRYVLIVILASLFHTTAIIMLCAFVLLIHIPKWVRVFLCLVVFLLIAEPVLTIEAVKIIAKYTPGKIGKLANGYLVSSLFGDGATLSTGFVFYTRQIFALFIVLFFSPKTQFEHFVMNALVCNMLLLNSSLAFSQLGRVAYYFGFYAIIGYAVFFDIHFLKRYKGIYCLSILLFFAFFFIPFAKTRLNNGISKLNGRPEQYQYIPYWNVFFHPENAWRKDWNQ